MAFHRGRTIHTVGGMDDDRPKAGNLPNLRLAAAFAGEAMRLFLKTPSWSSLTPYERETYLTRSMERLQETAQALGLRLEVASGEDDS